MKRNKKLLKKISNKICGKLILIAISLSVAGCVTTNNINKKDKATIRMSSFSFFAGPSIGGIIDNTETDAVSGATKIKYNAGLHSEINIKKYFIETGLDYITFSQTFIYMDTTYEIDGTRNFSFQQLRLPLTCNFHFFKNAKNNPLLILKLGLSIGYTFSIKITDSGILPDYFMETWDFGPGLGLSIHPITISNKFDLGLYYDLYRGRRIYRDFYNMNMGNLSFMKFGLGLRFNN